LSFIEPVLCDGPSGPLDGTDLSDIRRIDWTNVIIARIGLWCQATFGLPASASHFYGPGPTERGDYRAAQTNNVVAGDFVGTD
jgi:hypothetical protein